MDGGRTQQPSRWLRFVPVAFAALVGVALTLVLTSIVLERQRSEVWDEFRQLTHNIEAPLRRGVEDNLEVLQSIVSLYDSSREVDRIEFELFTQWPLRQAPHTGIRFLAWLPRVTPAELAEHHTTAYSLFKVHEGYRIRDLGDRGDPPQRADRDRYPVQFIEPFRETRPLWGLDLAQSDECVAVMREADEDAGARATAPITLQASPAGTLRLDCLVFHPVYKDGPPGDKPGKQLVGYALAALDLDKMIEAPLSRLNREGLAIYLYDRTETGEARLVHASGDNGEDRPGPRVDPAEDEPWPPRFETEIRQAGRRWTLICAPTSAYLAQRGGWRPWAILVAGLLFTVLGTTYLNTQLGRTARVEQLVAQRTSELALANKDLEREIAERRAVEETLRTNRELLQAFLDNSPAVIYMKDPLGRYLLVNRRYETLFNIPREQLIGQTVAALLPPEAAARIQENDRKVLEAGKPLEFEEKVPLGDGDHVYLSVKFPLRDPDGVPRAVCGIATDISERKKAEEELRHSGERFLVQQSALIALTRSEALQAEGLGTTFQHMTEVIAETLGVERVSIWRYTKDRRAIVCEDLFELSRNRHSSGLELLAKRYPAYFRALGDSEIIAADDARDDPRTKDFEAYLSENGITSMMDVPLYLLGNLDGVICHEHVGSRRRWLPDEKMFAVAVANLVSLAVGQWEHRRAERLLEDSEALYHSLVENLPQNIIRKDLEGRFTFLNQRVSATMGKPLDEIIGKTDYDFFPRELAEKYRRDDQQVIAGGKAFETVEAHVTGDGRRLYVHVIKTPVRGADGKIIGTQILFWDVTAAKENERRLAVQYAISRLLSEAATLDEATPRILQAVGENLDWPAGAIWNLDRDAGLLRCVEFWHRLDVDVAEFEKVTREIVFASGVGLPGRVWARGEPAWIRDVTKDENFPRAKWAAANGLHAAFGFPIRVGHEVLGAIEFFSRDIRQPDAELLKMFAAVGSQLGQFIERRRAEEALRTSEERFALSVRGTNDGLWDWDVAADQVYFSPRWKNMIGYEDHEIGNRFEEWEKRLHPEDRERALDAVNRYLAGKTAQYELEHRLRCKDGSYRWILARGFALRDAEGRPYRMAGSHTDITERKQAEERLRLQNKLLQEMALLERQAHEELKKAQGQLVQAEKMSSLGQMVAGVAHEINNPLSFVSNNVAVLQRDVQVLSEIVNLYQQATPVLAEHDAELHARIRDLCERVDLDYTRGNLEELLSRSRDGLKRIQQIVMDLRDFARLDESDLHEVDLNPGIESTVNIIRGLAKKKQVEIKLELERLPRVSCFPAKVNQVVMNLAVNAIQACPDKGKVTIRTAANNGEVEIHVIDDGPGIPAAIRDKIFDPFFTTKPPGQGTGLGLSISHGIIEDHGGRIEVNSNPGEGAHFIVYLPLRARPTQARPEAETEPIRTS